VVVDEAEDARVEEVVVEDEVLGEERNGNYLISKTNRRKKWLKKENLKKKELFRHC
jgi:hypothetical protein